MVAVTSAKRGFLLLLLNWKLIENSKSGFNITPWFIQT